MANILLIGSATKVCSVAIAAEGEVACVHEIEREEYSHAELLTVFIKDLLHGPWSDKSIDAICFMDGPGSYTGLRIGCSAAKGLCYAMDIPLIAVGSLYSWAAGLRSGIEVGENDLIIPMMDARRMEVYWAKYDASLKELQEPGALILDEGSSAEIAGMGNIHLVGDGVQKASELFASYKNIQLHDVMMSATFMAEEAERRFMQKEFENLAYFEPFYLKDFVPGRPKKVL